VTNMMIDDDTSRRVVELQLSAHGEYNYRI